MDQHKRLIQELTAFYREEGSEASLPTPRWSAHVMGNRFGWLQPVVASVALVLVVIGAAIGLRVAREAATVKVKPTPIVTSTVSPAPSVVPSATPSATPSPTPLSSWITRRVALPGQVYFVQAMALDSGAVFALYSPTSNNPHDNSQTALARVDRTTGKVGSNGPFPGGFQLLRVGGALWVLGGMNGGPAVDKYWMDLVDPVTLQVKSRLWVPGQAGPTAFALPVITGASNVMWLGYGQHLYRLDVNTGKVLATVNLTGTVTSVSLDPSALRLYAGVIPQGYQAQVIEFSGNSGTRLRSTPTGGGDLGGPQVAASVDSVWIAYATGMMGQVEHRSAATLALIPNPSQVEHTNGISVVVGPTSVWYLDGMAQQVACADPRSGAIASAAGLAFPAALVVDAKGVYAAVQGEIDFLEASSCPS